jgi:hypothetical protein
MRIFVSYKSEDCNVAREVVEILISTALQLGLPSTRFFPRSTMSSTVTLRRTCRKQCAGVRMR